GLRRFDQLGADDRRPSIVNVARGFAKRVPARGSKTSHDGALRTQLRERAIVGEPPRHRKRLLRSFDRRFTHEPTVGFGPRVPDRTVYREYQRIGMRVPKLQMSKRSRIETRRRIGGDDPLL